MNSTQFRQICDVSAMIPITPNLKMVEYWWDVINENIFDSKLKKPNEFIIDNKCQTFWAWTVPCGHNTNNRSIKLRMSGEVDNLYLLLNLLIHEAIHAWEWETFPNKWYTNTKHGRDFYSWRNTVADKTGFKLTSKY